MTRKGNVSNHLDVPNTRECAPPMRLGGAIGKLEALALFTSPRYQGCTMPAVSPVIAAMPG